MAKKSLAVVVSLDVEEEGLFSGTYPRDGAGLSNIAELPRLAFLPTEFGLPLTYLCDYPVMSNGPSCEVLAGLLARCGGELGAHLHPWNTPPFPELPWPEPVSTAVLPRDVFRAKLDSLQGAVAAFAGAPAKSFRMGRWNLFPRAMAELPGAGFLVDSSVVPLRHVPGGPDHFLAPPDPYWVRLGGAPDADGAPGARLLEAPSTQLPLIPGSQRLAYALAQRLPAKRDAILGTFMKTATLGINPVWMPEATMKLAALVHARRGGQVLTLFWHSSELLPGASPHFPDRAAVDAFVAKVRRFADWLRRTFTVTGTTLGELAGPAFSWPECSPASRPNSTQERG